ncbi:MAG: S9 family peptidase, partial [Bacteroidota bacterium]|nr:S9 family peptidase [Bacteroidota bacterium]
MKFVRYLISGVFLFGMMHLSAQEVLTPEKMWKMGRVSGLQVSPTSNTILYGISKYELQKNSGNRDLYILEEAAESPRKISSFQGSEFNAVWRPDGEKIAFISAEGGSLQMWEMNTNGTNKKQITNIEGGITGFKYSPDMTKILFIKSVKVDKTANDIHKDLPLANALIIDDLMYRHWDHWEDASYNHIFIADYSDGSVGKVNDIMDGERYDSPSQPWGGMEEINWSPDSKTVAYTCKKLVGKEYAESTDSEIYLYNLASRNTENISAKGFDGYDKEPVFSPDGKKLVWWSMKTPGFEADKQRIIIYDIATKTTNDISAGFDQSSSNFVWSDNSKNLYFISGIEATYQIFKLNIKKGDIEQVTEGVHNYTSFALSGKNIVGTKMSMSMPTEIFNIDKKGNETQLTFTNKKILDEFEMGNVEKRWIETTDGKKMLTWVIYPPDFDKTKKYPALLYCQGGPQSAVSQFFSYRWNFQIMAANGYIIVAPNRRGLPSFGQEWNDQISQDYGGQNMEDYLAAIDEVAKEDFVDENNLGAVGASYGGFSVYYLAGHHNGRFKTFISHCGMFNFESWYGTTEELWFPNHDIGGAYWEKDKPKSYDYSPHKFVGNWDTPILVITGGKDFRIPYTESMQAFDAAQI